MLSRAQDKEVLTAPVVQATHDVVRLLDAGDLVLPRMAVRTLLVVCHTDSGEECHVAPLSVLHELVQEDLAVQHVALVVVHPAPPSFRLGDHVVFGQTWLLPVDDLVKVRLCDVRSPHDADADGGAIIATMRMFVKSSPSRRLGHGYLPLQYWHQPAHSRTMSNLIIASSRTL